MALNNRQQEMLDREIDRARWAIDALRQNLIAMEAALAAAGAGEALRSDDLLPAPQRLLEVATHGAAVRALWLAG